MPKAAFEVEIKPFKDGMKLVVNEASATILQEAFRKIVSRTPVASGFARSRWQIDVQKNSEGYFEGEITNDAPYIVFLEMGSSDQAPNGMVQITLEEIRNKYEI